ncbi:MAG: RHS repeat domain-containing protein [Thermoguttaceae bacterium]
MVSKIFYENESDYNSGTVKETWSYTYDHLGRVVKTDQAGRINTTEYDAQGRVTKITSPEGTVNYRYDDLGRQIRMFTDKGDDISYTYDAQGRLKTVKDSSRANGVLTTYYYDAVGNLSKTVLSTGLTTIYQYDNLNRLTKLSNFMDTNTNGIMDAGEGISQFDYLLDSQGNKTRADETFWVNGNANRNHIDWVYDDLGRLIEEKFDHYNDEYDQTLSFAYDKVGNRLLQKVDKGNNGTIDQVFQYYYDENDRLLEELFDGQNDGTFEKVTNYGYDHTQQTQKSVAENGVFVSETTFEYDVQGRMAVVTVTTTTGIEKTTYGYGANGVRVSAVHEKDGVVTKTEYLNDSRSLTGYSQVIRQTENVNGSVTKSTSYVIGHQRISQTVESATENVTHFFTFDGHGSTRVLLDATAAAVQLYAFDAYGNAIGFDPKTALTEFLYSGEQFDSKIGQQYLRARYYDPSTGRFNRLDPFFGNQSDPQSLHKYAYTHNNPVMGIDPSGQMNLGCVSMAMNIGMGIVKSTTFISIGTLLTSPVLGALHHAYFGQNPWLGAYTGSLIGSSLTAGFLVGRLGNNWQPLGHIIGSGAAAYFSRFLSELVFEWAASEFNDLQHSALRAHLDALDSAASAMSNAALTFCIPYERMEDVMNIVGLFTTAGNSILSDMNKTPRPTNATMVGNAAVAVSVQIASSWVSDKVKEKLQNYEVDTLSASRQIQAIIQEYVTKFAAEVLVGFDTKTIAGLVKLYATDNALNQYE